ncbi:MAG: hypothetical protein WD208_05735 [Dehalococcoidia bacterium]
MIGPATTALVGILIILTYSAWAAGAIIAWRADGRNSSPALKLAAWTFTAGLLLPVFMQIAGISTIILGVESSSSAWRIISQVSPVINSTVLVMLALAFARIVHEKRSGEATDR